MHVFRNNKISLGLIAAEGKYHLKCYTIINNAQRSSETHSGFKQGEDNGDPKNTSVLSGGRVLS